MGDCFYVSKDWRGKPKVTRIRSEDVGTTDEGMRAVARLTNTTQGIWFYERDILYSRKELKKELRELITFIDEIRA